MLKGLARLKLQKGMLTVELKKWSPECLRFRSTPSAWCALEVVDHVILTEDAIRRSIEEGHGSRRLVPVQDQFRNLMVMAVMMLPVRVRIPARAVGLVSPRQQKELPQLMEEWSTVRSSVARVFEALSHEEMKLGTFRHPVGGWCSADATLRFMNAHITHHRYQLNRIRSAVRFVQ